MKKVSKLVSVPNKCPHAYFYSKKFAGKNKKYVLSKSKDSRSKYPRIIICFLFLSYFIYHLFGFYNCTNGSSP